MNIEECINTYNEIVIGGLEGCKKTKKVIDIIIKKFANKEFGPKDIVILAFKSYTLMKEKQLDIIRDYGWEEKNVPIVAYNFNEVYQEYYTNKECPKLVPKEAKIVLMSQKGLQKCYHNFLHWENHSEKIIKWIVVDEFDACVGLIPSLHYLTEKYLDKEASVKMTENAFIKFIEEEYSYHDAKEFRDRMKDKSKMFDETFKEAYWISNNKKYGVKTIFLTAETLAIRILNAIGFSNPDLEYQKFLDHNIYLYPAKIDKYFFETLNRQNKWNIFRFDTIISDQCSNTILKFNLLDIKVINHSSVRGTNSLIGKNILTILSHIPSKVIEQIRTMLEYYEEEYVDYKEIERSYYRDRLHQACSRVIGHRGVCDPDNIVKTTYVIINNQICKNLVDGGNDPDLLICYKLSCWNYNNEELTEFMKVVEEFRENQKTKREKKTSEASKKHMEDLTILVEQLFEHYPGSRITYNDFIKIIKNRGEKIVKADIQKLAGYFKATTHRTSTIVDRKLKLYSYIKGLRLKNNLL